MLNKKEVFVLLGPTASGKSQIALELIKQSNNKIVVINSDSKQIYHELPILTAAPELDEINKYSHRLYRYKSIYESYDVTDWLIDTKGEIIQIHSKGKIPMLVGGTGFYINSLIYGISKLPTITEETRNIINARIENEGRTSLYKWLIANDPCSGNIEKNDTYRLSRNASILHQTGKPISHYYDKKIALFDYNIEFKIFSFLPRREKLYADINERFDLMLQKGVLNETYNVHLAKINNGLGPYINAYKIQGMPELLDYHAGKMSLSEASEMIKQNTRNYAKRQETWIRNSIKDKVTYDNKTDLMDCISRHTQGLH